MKWEILQNPFERCKWACCGIIVKDLDESVKFYAEVVGLEVSAHREKDYFFRIGCRGVLALIQLPCGHARFEAEMRPKYSGKVFTHFGFEADSVASVFCLSNAFETAWNQYCQGGV